ncbi:MAG: hypothetical protein HY013_10535 [Candidatus Solibacter usitatus]|nr:hypothetical protein [Candidatus Solibacter usitatus]
MNLGAKSGVRAGDRLEVRREGQAIGQVVVTKVEDSFSVGRFTGASPAKPGDTVTGPQPARTPPRP